MIRVGQGYDIHRFNETDTKNYIMLCGVKIEHEKSMLAHSDGDVAIHAICDALLGSLALGDIGAHFPDTDPQFKNKDSRELLRAVVGKVHSQGFRISNVDLTIIAEKPKLAPYIIFMREVMATDMQISINDISVKAKTNEKLDALGQKMGIAVHAIALVTK